MRNRLGRIKLSLRSLKYHYFDGFVFIHINKTGGSSIEKALNIPFEHKTAREKIQEMGQSRWNKKFSFAVVRNPWDKVVSHYHYRVKTNQTKLRENSIEFTEWVKRSYGVQDEYYYDIPKMFMPQVEWIVDNQGKIVVDKIMHFENLENEFNEVLEILGKKAALPHEKKSNRLNYREYYNNETIEIIRKWFQQDIDIFGYEY
jgi:hypothetical protein